MRLIKLLVAIAVFFSLAVTVFAHPGKTDSQGGHTDHSTGEYHYHHGYSAHQHYDSDGDGGLDCPYNFDNQTSSESGKSSKEETHVAQIKPGKKTVTEEEHKKGKTAFGHIKDALCFVYDVLKFCVSLFLGFMCLVVVIEMITKIFRWLFKR